MYDFEDEAKKVIDLRDTLVKHAEDAKLLTMDAADLPPALAQFQQRYKRFVIERRLQRDRDTTRDKLQMAKHGRFDLLNDEFLSEKAKDEDNDKLRAAFDLSGVQSKLVLQVEAAGGGNVVTPSAAMTNVSGPSTCTTGVTDASSATPAATSDVRSGNAASAPAPPATSSFTQADQPMYGDDDCMIVREATATKVISLPSSPTPSPKAPTTQSPQQQPQYSDHAPDGEVREQDDLDDQDDPEEDGDVPPKKKRLSKKQREKRKQLQQQQFMLQYQLRQQLMGQMNPSLYDPNNPSQPPLPKQPQPPAPGEPQTQASQGQNIGQQQFPFTFPPFNPAYKFNMPGMPPMPPMPPGMPPMPFWPSNFSPPPQPQPQPQPQQQPQQQQQRQRKTPDPNDVYGQPSYTDN